MVAAGVISAGVLLAGCSRQPPGEPATLVIRNARVYTVDEKQPWAQAVGIVGDRIRWVGTNEEMASHTGAQTKVVDAGARLLLPGFIDSHLHLGIGNDPDKLRITGQTLAEIQAQIREFADQHPQLTWIEGDGWNYSAFPHGDLPSAGDLEGLAGGRPIYLMAYDYHTAWLSREALAALGISGKNAKVAFANVQADARGLPSGILTDFASLGLAAKTENALDRLPSHAAERRYAGLKRNLDDALKFGITTIVEPQSSLDDLASYVQAQQKGDLQSRLQVALFHPRGTPPEMLEQFDEARRRYSDDRLRVSAIKLYIDDVIEPHTAAMLQPYADRPNQRGRTLYTPEEFKQVIARLDRMHFQVFIHSIGDRGIRTALDAIEYAEKANGARDRRDQLVHIECLAPQDIPRFKQLGVVACMQPRHCAPDITGQWARAVGPERSQYAWAFRSLRDSGATLAFASDWNVAEMDPLIGIYTALTRKGLDGKPDGGWIPAQTIDLATAIKGYTLNGAYANFVEPNRGSITPGKYADLVLLSENLFELPPDRIKGARVVMTMVGGKELYRAF
jgi:hypothetical protein